MVRYCILYFVKFMQKIFGVLAVLISVAFLCAAYAPIAQASPGQAWLEIITPVARVTVGEGVAVSTYVNRQDTMGNSQATPTVEPRLASDPKPKELVAVKNKPSSSTPPKSPGTSGRASATNPQTSSRALTSGSAGATNTNATHNPSSPAAQSAQTTPVGQTAHDRRLIDAINANTHLSITNASTPKRSNWLLLALPVALLAHAIWKSRKVAPA